MMRRGTRQLRWIGEKNGQPVEVHREPDTSWFQRGWVRFARRFPHIERFL